MLIIARSSNISFVMLLLIYINFIVKAKLAPELNFGLFVNVRESNIPFKSIVTMEVPFMRSRVYVFGVQLLF